VLEVLNAYAWPNDGLSFEFLMIRVDDLAKHLGLTIQSWDVDGLGPARGFGFRLPSGRVYLTHVVELAVRPQGARGPTA
jgi:hypothetical protein